MKDFIEPRHPMLDHENYTRQGIVDISKRRPGRPRKDPADLKRHNVTIAMADQTRRKIGEAAKRNGRSLSSEIDYRLERSFRDDDVAEAIWSRLAEKASG
jgi:hypothetical protein